MEQPIAQQSEQGFILPYGDCPTIEENVAEMIYMDIINHATKYVHITTPYFIVDNAMLDALQDIHSGEIQVARLNTVVEC